MGVTLLGVTLIICQYEYYRKIDGVYENFISQTYPELHPPAYKNVKVYLGKEALIHPKGMGGYGKQKKIEAANGKVKNMCVTWDSRRTDDIMEIGG